MQVVNRQVIRKLVAVFGLMILSVAFTTNATAHKMRPAVALVMLHLDGTFSLEMRLNAEAILADIDPGD